MLSLQIKVSSDNIVDCVELKPANAQTENSQSCGKAIPSHW